MPGLIRSQRFISLGGGGFAVPDLFPGLDAPNPNGWRLSGTTLAEQSGSLLAAGFLQDLINGPFLVTQQPAGKAEIVDGAGPMGQRALRSPYSVGVPGGCDCICVLAAGHLSVYARFLYMMSSDTNNAVKIFRMQNSTTQSVSTPGIYGHNNRHFIIGLDNWATGGPTEANTVCTPGQWYCIEWFGDITDPTHFHSKLWINDVLEIDIDVPVTGMTPDPSSFLFRRLMVDGEINEPESAGFMYWTDFAASTRRIGIPPGFVP